MIEIAICDDKIKFTTEIEKMINDLCLQYDVDVEIDVFYDGATLVNHVNQGKSYDLIYLDIEMKYENGIDAARHIREKDSTVLLIYVTSHESFAKEVFEVSAFRFITKPVDKQLFEKYFLSAIKIIQVQPVYYKYQYNKIHYKLQIKDIIYFQSDKRVTYIITVNGERKCYEKLNDIEAKLKEASVNFMRTHQSFLVNTEYIEKYMYDSMILTDGSSISISIKRRKEVNKQYCSYMGDKVIG
ncbi:LytR/AlgR family response regulator transcription factor [Anaerosporobacter sp.]|uniref:LytR/AlgR family response regulator transcription factor n=1 Tax=Anaerosporobacter sp. TaxID=1872529 RepID=UPI00286F74BE|nr:LytTR family DNA-binding domain-containing protein [Anaerosporobacter sp.]